MGNKGEVGHPSDVTDEEWEFALPYLLLSREDSAYREHDLRTVFNGVRSIARTGNQWRFIPHDYPPWPAIISRCSAGCGPDVSSGWLKTPASCGASLLGARASRPQSALIAGRSSPRPSGARAGYDGAKRRKGSKVHIAVDTLGHLLALRVTAADQGDRAQVETLAEDMQAITGGTVEMAFVDQGYTGPNAAETGTEPRHPARRGQAPAGQAWLRAAAAPLGCREKLRLGRQISPTRKRLSTTRHYPQRFPLHRLPLPHDRKHLQTTRLNFITAHRACRQSG